MDRVPRSIAERRVFVDTSAFFAVSDRNDRFHRQAVASLERLQRGSYRLVTTRYVVFETHARILAAGGADLARTFLQQIHRGGIAIVPTTDDDEARAEEIIFKHLDKAYSLCDAMSFAVMERFGLRLAFAYNDHFRQHGFPRR